MLLVYRVKTRLLKLNRRGHETTTTNVCHALVERKGAIPGQTVNQAD